MPNRYLDEHGLNTLWDDIEKYHNTTQHETDGAIDGALLELTAKSKPATQQTTVGKNLLDDSKSMSNADYKVFGGTLSSNDPDGTFILDAGTYTVSSTITVQVISVRLSASESLVYMTNATVGSFTLSNRAAIKVAIGKNSTDNWSDFGLQLELGSTATPYEPYTGGAPSPSPDYPQPIVTVRGRNLYDGTRVAGYVSADGSISGIGEYSHSNAIAVESGKSYVWSGLSGYPHTKRVHACDANGNFISSIASALIDVGAKYDIVFEVPAGVHYVMGTFHNSDSKLQLAEGSTHQPYVPYGHVGLERRDSQGTLLDTTPIPLPSRGWVAGLPDGTADELTVDGAGKVMWELKTGREQYSSTEMTFTENKYGVPKKSVNAYMSWSYPKICTIVPPISAASNANRVYFDTRYNSKLETYEGEFELYWKLQTPVTEDCGYVDLPSMQDCVLSIPELDALGVRYTIGDGAEIARQWYQRAYAELGDAIVDLTDRVVELEQRVPEQ